MRRKRILFVGHTSSPGGAELALLRMIRHLDRAEYEPIVLLFEEGELSDMLRGEGVSVHLVPLFSEAKEMSRHAVRWSLLKSYRIAAGTLRHIGKLAAKIKELQVDVVHTNTLKADILGGCASVLARRPLVWHVHDRIAADYMPSAAVKLIRGLARLLPKHIIANSEATLKTLPSSPKRCTVVYPGIDLADFTPKRVLTTAEGIDEAEANLKGAVTVGIVGRIGPTKGQLVFVEAALLVNKRYPATRFKIIGRAMFNDQPYEDELKARIGELKLDQVQMMGYWSNVSEAMFKLDMVVHASTVPEPFGQVVVEAMACGKVAIASNAGGITEIVRNGETGWVVPPNDAQAIAERIIWCIENPAEALLMGTRAAEEVSRRFTIQETALRVERVYRQVLSIPEPAAGEPAPTTASV